MPPEHCIGAERSSAASMPETHVHTSLQGLINNSLMDNTVKMPSLVSYFAILLNAVERCSGDHDHPHANITLVNTGLEVVPCQYA